MREQRIESIPQASPLQAAQAPHASAMAFQRDSPEHLSRGLAQVTAEDHAFALNQATASQPARAPQTLLRLQKRYGNRHVQRVLALARKGEGEPEVASDVESAIERSRGGGRALDAGVRGQMESAFGADFGGVRIHTGAEPHALNRAVNAVAFTTGQDIFFTEGAYNPGSSGGRELLAHELTHVVQQNGAGFQTKLVVGAPDDLYEQEADAVARTVVNALDGGASSASPGPSLSAPGHVQRQCGCGGNSPASGECDECKKKQEALTQQPSVQQLLTKVMQRHAIQRRTVCPPGVSGEDGTGCYEVADDAPANQNAADSGGAPAAEVDAGSSSPATSMDAGAGVSSSGADGAPAADTDITTSDASAGVVPVADAGAGGAPANAADPNRIANLPGTDYQSCVDQTDEDTAKFMDTINTACSVKGAAFALGGGALGAFAGPIGAGIGAVAGGMYGAYNYGKCVEEQNAKARAGAREQKAQCGQRFPH